MEEKCLEVHGKKTNLSETLKLQKEGVFALSLGEGAEKLQEDTAKWLCSSSP